MKRKSIVILLSLGLFIFVFLLASYLSVIGIDPHHDGIILKPALDVFNGKILFKESYTPYGALSTYLHAFSMFMLGPSLVSIKLAESFFYSLTAVVLFLITKRLFSILIALIVVSIWIMTLPFLSQPFYPWPSIAGSFFILFAALIYLVKKPKITIRFSFFSMRFYTIGTLLSLAFWVKQPFLLTFLFILLFLFLQAFYKRISRRQLIKLMFSAILGFSFVSLLMFIPIYLTGALHDWFLQTVWLGYITGRVIGNGFSFVELGRFFVTHPFFFVIMICLLYAGVKSFRQSSTHKISQINNQKLFLFCIALSSVFYIYPAYDYSHVFWALTPSYVYLGYIFQKTVSVKKPLPFFQVNKISILLFMTILIGGMLFQSIGAFIHKSTRHYVSVTEPSILSGMKTSRDEAAFYSELNRTINDYMRQNQDATLVTTSNDALYMTFTDQAKSIGPLYVNFSALTSAVYPYNPDLELYIDRYKPLVIITDQPYHLPQHYVEYKNWEQYSVKLLIHQNNRM